MTQLNLKSISILALFLLIFQNAYSVGYAEADQIKSDTRIVKQKVVEWCDKAFYFHEDYRFENFHAFYTDEFYIVMLRSDSYKKKIENLLDSKTKGTFPGTSNEFKSKLSSLESKYKRFQIMVEGFAVKCKYYEVLFWSNIKTKHGYSVYYSHRFRLSNDFIVMSAKIKSSIGNKSADNKIIYN